MESAARGRRSVQIQPAKILNSSYVRPCLARPCLAGRWQPTTPSSSVVDDVLRFRRKINGGLERVAAGFATPQMPYAALFHKLRPHRSKQIVSALSTLIEYSFCSFRRPFTKFHDDTSSISFSRIENVAPFCDSKNTIVQTHGRCD